MMEESERGEEEEEVHQNAVPESEKPEIYVN
jgi:hypothetical protein